MKIIIKKIELTLKITMKNYKYLSILNKATSPENKLAPEKMKITNHLRDDTLTIEITYRPVDNELKLNTFRRTVDDYVWSLNTVYKVLMSMEKGNKNEV